MFTYFPIRTMNNQRNKYGVKNSAENLDWLQILIAPKVFLLEYASSLLSK